MAPSSMQVRTLLSSSLNKQRKKIKLRTIARTIVMKKKKYFSNKGEKKNLQMFEGWNSTKSFRSNHRNLIVTEVPVSIKNWCHEDAWMKQANKKTTGTITKVNINNMCLDICCKVMGSIQESLNCRKNKKEKEKLHFTRELTKLWEGKKGTLLVRLSV